MTDITRCADNWASAHRNTINSKPKSPTKINADTSGSCVGKFNQTINSETTNNNQRVIKCFSCGSLGHTRAKCPQIPTKFPRYTGVNSVGIHSSLGSRISSKYLSSGVINHTHVDDIVRDTGCSSIIISDKVLPDADYSDCDYVTLQDYLGRRDAFPIVRCHLTSDFLTGWVNAVRAPLTMCSVLIGNVPGVKDDKLMDRVKIKIEDYIKDARNSKVTKLNSSDVNVEDVSYVSIIKTNNLHPTNKHLSKLLTSKSATPENLDSDKVNFKFPKRPNNARCKYINNIRTWDKTNLGLKMISHDQPYKADKKVIFSSKEDYFKTLKLDLLRINF